MSKKVFLGLILVLGLAVACAPPPATTPTPAPFRGESQQASEEFQYSSTASRGLAGTAGPSLPAAPKPYAAGERMIVRNGSLSLVVDSVVTAADEVVRIAVELGGFVVSSSLRGEGKAISAQLTIRVPVERFDEALGRLRRLAVRVATENTSGQDVTQEYTDLQAQLRNLEAAEAQLQRIMQRAEKVEDVLSVYRELINTRGQIEQAKGRMQYLERTSAMSAIAVDLRPASSPEPLVRTGWSAAEILKEAVRGLTAWGQGLASAIIWAGVFAPLWGSGLVAAFVVGLVVRRWVKGRPPRP